VREVQVTGTGDPQGPPDDAAVAVVQFHVMRDVLAGGTDLAEDGPLQAGLVALDEQEVIRCPVPGRSG
jgi:hypothetical protein